MNAFVRFLAANALLLMTHCNIRSAQAAPHEAWQRELRHRSAGREIKITIVFEPTLQRHGAFFEKISREAIEIVEKKFGFEFRDDLWLHFDPEPDFHNGLSTVLPNNRIYVHTEAPLIEESIGLGSDYLLDTVVHELGHMASLQQRRGLFAFLNFFVGNAARPNGSWPRWIHEGSAVWAESAVGGRPASGFIDWELRKYADAKERLANDPVENFSLDGGSDSRAVESGGLPYHFGYLLLREWASLSKKENFAPFVNESSSNLGLSFRATFRATGVSLDEAFASAQKKWAETKLPRQKIIVPFRSARKIRGPFSGEHPTWIEEQDPKDPRPRLIALLSDKEITETSWKQPRSLPLQNFLISKLEKAQRWIVLLRQQPLDVNTSARREVWELDEHGEKICAWSLPPRLREIFFREGQLAWIRSTEEGLYFAETTARQGECQGSAPRELARSHDFFERLSNVYIDEKGEWSLSRSRGRDSFHEEIEKSNGDRLANDGTLTQELSWPDSAMGPVRVAQLMSPHYWGPVLIKNNETRRLPLRTGSSRSAVFQRELLVKESRWEDDRLLLVGAQDFEIKAPGLHRLAPSTPSTPEPAQNDAADQDYRALPSLWPHFWLPSVAATGDGWIAMGETFYQDLRRRWSGYTQAGYDSFVHQPFVISSLDYNRRGTSSSLKRIRSGVEYSPALLLGQVQKRWAVSVGPESAHDLGAGWRLSVNPGLSYLGGGAVHSATIDSIRSGDAFNRLSPSIGFELASDDATGAFNGLWRLPQPKTTFIYGLRSRWIRSFDSYQNAVLHFPLGPTRFQTQFEVGWTSKDNFPINYFEFGGTGLVTTRNQRFLARGFPINLMIGPLIGRANFEWGAELFDINRHLSWNRGHLTALEGRLVFESVTRASFFENSRYAFGRQYFSSLGGELDLSGQLFHYVLFKSSLGYFRGFGPFGENRITLSLRSFLDL